MCPIAHPHPPLPRVLPRWRPHQKTHGQPLQRAVEAVRRVLRGEPLVNPQDVFTCVRSLPHGHGRGALKQLPAHPARPATRWRELAVALIAARVIGSRSWPLAPESAVSTGEIGLGGVDARTLRGDGLAGRRQAEQRLAKPALVLYDLTSSYLEGTRCPLARRGQATARRAPCRSTSTGCRWRSRYSKSTADPNTVASQSTSSGSTSKRVVLVGDRGMLTAARIREDLAGGWTALDHHDDSKLVAGTVTPSPSGDLAEITSEEFPGDARLRLLAAERGRKRQALLQATKRNLSRLRRRPGARRIRCARRPPSACASARCHYKVAHFLTTITDTTFTFRRDADKIATRRRSTDSIS